MHKILWFDTETTGLDAEEHDVIQIAGKVFINSKMVEEFNLRCQPHSYENISEKALEVNGLTVEELKTYPPPEETFKEFQAIMDRHVNSRNKADKFVPAGQNVRFDMDMMQGWWKKCGSPFWFAYIFPAPLCTMTMAVMLELKEGKKIFIPNYKLETMCKCLGIKLDNAHDALADIDATRQVANVIWTRLMKNETRGQAKR